MEGGREGWLAQVENEEMGKEEVSGLQQARVCFGGSRLCWGNAARFDRRMWGPVLEKVRGTTYEETGIPWMA